MADSGSSGSGLTLEELTRIQREFARERGWETFHGPRNLILALVGEVGELAECFQWLGDDGAKPGLPGLSKEKREHIGDELADVLCYLIRLADVCQVDLSEAVLGKISKNAEKYPAHKAYGSCAKYTAYQDDGT
jgi:dCTP diphosphatase